MLRNKKRGIAGTDFQSKDLDCECEFYEITTESHLLRKLSAGKRSDTRFDEMRPLCSYDVYHLYF
jgi:hypothetical protein